MTRWPSTKAKRVLSALLTIELAHQAASWLACSACRTAAGAASMVSCESVSSQFMGTHFITPPCKESADWPISEARNRCDLPVPARAHLPMMYTPGDGGSELPEVPARAHLPMMYTFTPFLCCHVRVPARAHLPMMYTEDDITTAGRVVPARAHLPMMYTKKPRSSRSGPFRPELISR